MKLYQYGWSPNCQKVVALAHEASVPLEIVDVDIFKGQGRSPEMLARNPNGKVPILEDDDFVLWESNAMLGYIAAKADRSDLAPSNPRERADVDRWLSWQTAHFGPPIQRVAFQRILKKLANLGAPDEAIIKTAVDEFAVFAKVLDVSLAGKQFLCGRLTIADFALAPAAALTESCGLDLSPYPNARVWLGRMLARESLKKTLAAVRS
jgi:glutathione S-transferase